MFWQYKYANDTHNGLWECVSTRSLSRGESATYSLSFFVGQRMLTCRPHCVAGISKSQIRERISWANIRRDRMRNRHDIISSPKCSDSRFEDTSSTGNDGADSMLRRYEPVLVATTVYIINVLPA